MAGRMCACDYSSEGELIALCGGHVEYMRKREAGIRSEIERVQKTEWFECVLGWARSYGVNDLTVGNISDLASIIRVTIEDRIDTP